MSVRPVGKKNKHQVEQEQPLTLSAMPRYQSIGCPPGQCYSQAYGPPHYNHNNHFAHTASWIGDVAPKYEFADYSKHTYLSPLVDASSAIAAAAAVGAGGYVGYRVGTRAYNKAFP